jgi:hypothetical protein
VGVHERFFHGQSPLGRKVREAGKVCTVVGMARDSKYFSPGEAPSPHFYLAFSSSTIPALSFISW